MASKIHDFMIDDSRFEILSSLFEYKDAGTNGAEVALARKLGMNSRQAWSNLHSHSHAQNTTHAQLNSRGPQKFTSAILHTNMRLTTDLINGSLSFINCLTERELDLRGAFGKSRYYT